MGLETGHGRGGRSGMSGKQTELSDYGRAHIWEWMEFLSRYAAKQGRTVYAYIDGAISYTSFKTLDPRRVDFLRKKMPKAQPWGFFIGGQGTPEKLPKADRANVAEALGRSFPLEVLNAAAVVAAEQGQRPRKAAEV